MKFKFFSFWQKKRIQIKANQKFSAIELKLRYAKPLKAMLIFSLPTIFIMLTIALYGLVDKFFVQLFAADNLINNDYIHYLWNNVMHEKNPLTIQILKTFLNVALQYDLVFFYLGISVISLLGIGASINYSIAYGKKDYEKMRQIFANTIILNFLFSFLVFFFLFFFTYPGFGSLFIRFQQGFGKATFNPIVSYITWKFLLIFYLFLPFAFINFLLNNIIKAQGNRFSLVFVMILSVFVNIGFDVIFIIYCHLITDGAMLATGCAYIFNIILAIILILRNPDHRLRLNWESFRFKPVLFGFILRSGATSGITKFANAIFSMINSIFIVNLLVNKSVFIHNNLSMLQEITASLTPWLVFVTNVCIGINQGSRILISYAHGAQKYKRIKSITKYSFLFQALWITFSVSMLMIFSSFFLHIFNFETNVHFNYHLYVIFYIWSFPFASLTFSAIILFSSIQKSKFSIIIALIRSVFAIIILQIIGFIISNQALSINSKFSGLPYFISVGSRDLFTMIPALAIFLKFYQKNKSNIVDHQKEEDILYYAKLKE